MRRFFLAALLILLVSTSAFAMKNEPDGYGGVKWGDKLSQHPDLKEGFGASFYYRPNEQSQMEQLDMTDVFYYFDEKEGFYWVIILVPGENDVQELKKEYWSKWGKPDLAETSENGGVLYFEWRGKRTRISLTHSAEMDIAQLDIADTERFNRVDKQ